MRGVRKLSNTSGVLLTISSIYSSLTKTEKKVADMVQGDPDDAVVSTVTDLAEKAGVGETSVIRFCRKLGFRGYHEFKLLLAQDLVVAPSYMSGEINDSDDSLTIAQKIASTGAQMIQNSLSLVQPEDLNRAAAALTGARRIYVYGVGSSGITALDAHYWLMRLGLPSEVHRDSHVIAMSAALAGKGDVVFGISTSGSTRDLVDPVREAKNNGATVICLTSHAKSPITQCANIVLLVPSRESPYQGGALSTKLAQIYMIEVLCTLMITRNKETAIDAIKKTAKSVADKLY